MNKTECRMQNVSYRRAKRKMQPHKFMTREQRQKLMFRKWIRRPARDPQEEYKPVKRWWDTDNWMQFTLVFFPSVAVILSLMALGFVLYKAFATL